MELLNTKEELIDGAALYLRIYFLGMPALGLYNFGNAVFSAVGDTRRPLRYLSLAGVVNIVLNLFFVIVCGMDVAGVATASVIAQYLSAGLVVTALFRSHDEMYGLHFLAAGVCTAAAAGDSLHWPAGRHAIRDFCLGQSLYSDGRQLL